MFCLFSGHAGGNAAIQARSLLTPDGLQGTSLPPCQKYEQPSEDLIHTERLHTCGLGKAHLEQPGCKFRLEAPNLHYRCERSGWHRGHIMAAPSPGCEKGLQRLLEQQQRVLPTFAVLQPSWKMTTPPWKMATPPLSGCSPYWS